MKTLLSGLAIGAVVALALLLSSPASGIGITQTYGICATTATCVTTGGAQATSTIGVIGILAPDSAHFASALIIIIFPLAFAMFFVIGADYVIKEPVGDSSRKGDLLVHAILGGLWVGSVVADLSTQSAPPAGGGFVPFGTIILATVIWVLWWWNS